MNPILHNNFTNSLPADLEITNYPRQVFGACFSFVSPKKPTNPKVIHVSKEVAKLLGFIEKDIASEEFLSFVSGDKNFENFKPFAMNYAGHQFGNWAGQLGDGRAIMIAEIEHQKQIYCLQLKGAGPTPYSRSADGFAVLRSSVREHLCSEAMHHLNVPTTRSLSIISTGDAVLRDVLYNGNAAYEKGAVVCRVAPSFIRFGNFELLAAQGDEKNLQILIDYCIKNYCPEIITTGKEANLAFFEFVAKQNLKMVLDWQRVGFVHGVMNTDNMSILGLTIDYGPYGWLENYDPNWTPNTTDRQNHRYAYGKQPQMVLWNLYQLANALQLVIKDAKALEEILQTFQENYEENYALMMLKKLGLKENNAATNALISSLEENLQATETDFTIFFRKLANIEKNITPLQAFETISTSFYNLEEITVEIKEKWLHWFKAYLNCLLLENVTTEDRKKAMDLCNPKYVLRNYMAQLAIEAAEKDDYSLVSELYELLQNPYAEQPESEKWFAKRPDWARNKIGASVLSCSS